MANRNADHLRRCVLQDLEVRRPAPLRLVGEVVAHHPRDVATRNLLVTATMAAACATLGCSESALPAVDDLAVLGDASGDASAAGPPDFALRQCRATITPSDGRAAETKDCISDVRSTIAVTAKKQGAIRAVDFQINRRDFSRFEAGTFGPEELFCALSAETSTVIIGWGTGTCPADTKLVLEWVQAPSSGRGTFDVTLPAPPPRTDTAHVHVDF